MICGAMLGTPTTGTFSILPNIVGGVSLSCVSGATSMANCTLTPATCSSGVVAAGCLLNCTTIFVSGAPLVVDCGSTLAGSVYAVGLPQSVATELCQRKYGNASIAISSSVRSNMHGPILSAYCGESFRSCNFFRCAADVCRHVDDYVMECTSACTLRVVRGSWVTAQCDHNATRTLCHHNGMDAGGNETAVATELCRLFYGGSYVGEWFASLTPSVVSSGALMRCATHQSRNVSLSDCVFVVEDAACRAAGLYCVAPHSETGTLELSRSGAQWSASRTLTGGPQREITISQSPLLISASVQGASLSGTMNTTPSRSTRPTPTQSHRRSVTQTKPLTSLTASSSIDCAQMLRPVEVTMDPSPVLVSSEASQLHNGTVAWQVNVTATVSVEANASQQILLPWTIPTFEVERRTLCVLENATGICTGLRVSLVTLLVDRDEIGKSSNSHDGRTVRHFLIRMQLNISLVNESADGVVVRMAVRLRFDDNAQRCSTLVPVVVTMHAPLVASLMNLEKLRAARGAASYVAVVVGLPLSFLWGPAGFISSYSGALTAELAACDFDPSESLSVWDNPTRMRILAESGGSSSRGAAVGGAVVMGGAMAAISIFATIRVACDKRENSEIAASRDSLHLPLTMEGKESNASRFRREVSLTLRFPSVLFSLYQLLLPSMMGSAVTCLMYRWIAADIWVGASVATITVTATALAVVSTAPLVRIQRESMKVLTEVGLQFSNVALPPEALKDMSAVSRFCLQVLRPVTHWSVVAQVLTTSGISDAQRPAYRFYRQYGLLFEHLSVHTLWFVSVETLFAALLAALGGVRSADVRVCRTVCGACVAAIAVFGVAVVYVNPYNSGVGHYSTVGNLVMSLAAMVLVLTGSAETGAWLGVGQTCSSALMLLLVIAQTVIQKSVESGRWAGLLSVRVNRCSNEAFEIEWSDVLVAASNQRRKLTATTEDEDVVEETVVPSRRAEPLSLPVEYAEMPLRSIARSRQVALGAKKRLLYETAASRGIVRPPSERLLYETAASRGIVRPPSERLLYETAASRGIVRPPSERLLYETACSRGIVRPPSERLLYETAASRGIVRPPSAIVRPPSAIVRPPSAIVRPPSACSQLHNLQMILLLICNSEKTTKNVEIGSERKRKSSFC